MVQFLRNCYEKYERKTLTLIALQYINQGGAAMMNLSCTIYFFEQNIEPSTATLYMVLILLPTVLSFLFGALLESFSIFGKRGHLIISSLIQLIASVTIISVPFGGESESGFIFNCMVLNLGKVWMTPIIESMLVIQMRLDPERGAEDLETFGKMCQAFGSIIFCVVGGAISSPIWGEKLPHPRDYFYIQALIAALILWRGLVYPKASEKHGMHGHSDSSTVHPQVHEKSLKEKFKLL